MSERMFDHGGRRLQAVQVARWQSLYPHRRAKVDADITRGMLSDTLVELNADNSHARPTSVVTITASLSKGCLVAVARFADLFQSAMHSS